MIPAADQYADGQAVRIFPNPANSHLELRSAQSIKRITVLSNTGQILMSQKEVAGQFYSLEASELAGGVYYLEIQLEDGALINKKFIVNR